MSDFTSEFLGTAILVMLGNALAASVLLSRTRAENAGWIAVSLGWGAALFVGVWIAASSGAHLNPAVTIALCAAHLIEPASLGIHIPAQLLGAAAGAVVATLPFLPHWRLTEDRERLLGCFCSVPAVRAPLSNLLAEAVGMFVLVFGIFAIVDHPWTPPHVVVIDADGVSTASQLWRAGWWQFAGGLGLLLAMIMLAIGSSMGGAMNPARDLSSRLVHSLLPIPGKGSSEWEYAWVPVIGPVLGALAGAFLAKAVGWQ